MLPVVALVGRPNVGKSTLFNQLTQSRDALVADMPGVTRDRQYGFCRLLEPAFIVVDTGGLMGVEDRFAGLTEKQVLAAIEEADAVVFLMDAREGFTPTDGEILKRLRRMDKPLLPVVNKVDGSDANVALADFHATGLGEPLAIAAAHRRGIADLLERLEPIFPEAEAEGEDEGFDSGATRIAVVGRPNVGKSTLINRILGEERVLATEVPGTTRDTLSIPVTRDGVDYLFLDTAGLRRKARVHETIEKFSAIKTLKAIEECDLVLLLLDAQAGIGEQDATILGHVLRSGRALLIAVNKWDGLERHQRTAAMRDFERKLGFADFAKVVPISALHGSGLGELFSGLTAVCQAVDQSLSTSQLTETLEQAVTAHPPPAKGGRAPRMRYAHAGGRNPHRIIIHGSRGEKVTASYRRYLSNQFRKAFKLVGCPVFIEFRSGHNPYAGKTSTPSKRQQEKHRRLKRHSNKKGRR